jgi:phage terminase small subunit
MAKKKTEAEKILKESSLTEANKAFCREYIFDWNGSRAYKIAYPDTTDESARVNASRLLTNDNIKGYIELIQKDLEKIAEVSRLKVIREHMKLAFSSIAHLHNTWIERKEFDQLTEEQKSCIAEISTQLKVQRGLDGELVENEYIKIKLYDKQKALDSISKMLGYDAPDKLELTGKDGKDLMPARVLSKEEAASYILKLEDEL